MYHFTADRIVNHSSQQMLSLVSDIERYPEFVPLCKKVVIHERDNYGENEVLVASMTINYACMQREFMTQVRINQKEHYIAVKHKKNLFNFLENHWHFEEISESKCKVHFSIKYELKNRLFDMMLKAIFDPSFLSFAKAFEERAHKIYHLPSL
ncbi:type II toxin-antitoxin system RatA family toxin [Candidatus Liberibacter asiaticus]